MGEQGPIPEKLRGPDLRFVQYDEAAEWARRVAEGREVRTVEYTGRRSGKTLRAVERAAALAGRGLNARVVVPHWFHTRATAEQFEGYRAWWECVICDAPPVVPDYVYQGGEFPPVRSCGFRPEPLGP
jgi:hypothetical protein